MGVRVLVCLLVVLSALSVRADPVRVIDGDTLEWSGQIIRLLNIDAPEMGQTCQTATGDSYRCGENAASALRALVAKGSLDCTGDERDQYDRLLAHCRVDGHDVGASLVANGLALAFTRYSDEYLDQQIDAVKAGRGLWAGSFDPPWEFRRARWTVAAQDAPRADCPIKGNISRSGERIYHTPYSRHYTRTRINLAAGEKWFCSEDEALAAGWRAPLW